MAKKTVEITESNFEQEIQSGIVIIDSWAEWCSPCKAISPVFDKLSESYGDKIKFGKLNTDLYPGVQRALKIMSIPTFIVFKDGSIVDRWSGANPDKLEKTVKKYAGE
jgi:thioredoxin 1